MNDNLPVLYSFRRCPYAMRARAALYKAGITYELREVSLKQKPPSMLQYSPKGTVPVLVLKKPEIVLEESIEIMIWALSTKLTTQEQLIIQENDGDFKYNLDRYKYPERYNLHNEQENYRELCYKFLQKMESQLTMHIDITQLNILEIAIFPFIRQCVKVDYDFFQQTKLDKTKAWVTGIEESAWFKKIMHKYPLLSE